MESTGVGVIVADIDIASNYDHEALTELGCRVHDGGALFRVRRAPGQMRAPEQVLPVTRTLAMHTTPHVALACRDASPSAYNLQTR